MKRVFGINACVEMGNSPRQVGTTDCGVYAIPWRTALVSGSEPEFPREELRYLVVFTPFSILRNSSPVLGRTAVRKMCDWAWGVALENF